jgi:hypothetical protein
MRAILVLCALAAPLRADTPKQPPPPTPSPALEGCPTRGAITLNTQLAADLQTTYELGKLRVCVRRADYPLMKRGGHSLFSCFSVGFGKDQEQFCGEGSTFADFHGYRIQVSLRKPRYTESCDVWLQIENAPKPDSV